ncbi:MULTISPECIES: sigma-54 dependent transcriptional regulator [unclassified Paracoccus (in: a-proteobacteria)]|uniref:sigma-54 dependent transcriptional regulator n=1 Tax=unclassified Paracoccus (in: a-proteobacteria) TaxID=2688777 RepID=UPI0021E1838F|nr:MULTISPECIES: sigma-54 dependent transcriptional regulator [unclassified Paracoccus (in: a-proteobacteria)]UXU74996.1 sigma-54 dependent transcriptional regulator [Paracoccus sp. SMMA_5]UXU80899.1 sigma-54 dependent transcriptional regulator [Paracoccus sp. SMMA_5_TC]
MDGTVLLADDDRTIRTVLTQALTRAGCRVHATGSLAQLLRWVEEGRGDLVVTDVMMPDGNGIDMIPAIRRARADLPVIVISAQNTIVTAIRATEAAAFDYLPKPFDLPELMQRAGQALAQRPRRVDPQPVQDDAGVVAPDGDPGLPLIGHAPVMQNLFRMVARVLNADLPVLIAGEPGVGRTMLARSFHDLSDRRAAGLAVLTSADVADEAIQRAGERAQAGTLLIEDPASLDAVAQARLIGMIETWEAGPGRAQVPRLLATAGPDPQADVAAGRLRADLYYRLAGVTITVPPLRARVDDIPPLARHLLARAAAQGLPRRTLSEGAAAAIRAHAFPGNVRELENLMRRLALTAAAPEITQAEARAALAETAPAVALQAAPASVAGSTAAPIQPGEMRLAQSVQAHLQRYFDLHGDALPPPGLYDRILREIERPLLQIALDATGGNQLRCADLLGINRNTLRKKLTELNIEVTRRRKLM